MKRAIVLLLLFGFLLQPAPVEAGKSCKNCSPAIFWDDGTSMIFTTEATSPYPEKNLRIYDQWGISIIVIVDGPVIVDKAQQLAQCLTGCTAQFWEHAGQWHPYSSMSDEFFIP